MTAAIVIACLGLGLVVREALFQRHLRRLAKQRVQDDFDSERLCIEMRAECDRIERVLDDGGAS